MKETITLRAAAKINLCLDIVGRRADGYHLLRSVMQTVSLCDTVTVTRRETGISVRCNAHGVPNGAENIAHTAVETFLKATGIPGGAEVLLEKQIPVQAGLGGGSADGAAVLRALNTLCGMPLTSRQLSELGAGIGADVPFCLCGGTVLCEGVGEQITPLPPMPDCFVVLCKPEIGVSTPEAFAAVDRADFCSARSCDGVVEAVRCGDLIALGRHLSNDFYLALRPLQTAEIMALMSAFSPLGAGLSGSGPTVFGLFDDGKAAERCADHLRRQYGQVWVTRPVGRPD